MVQFISYLEVFGSPPYAFNLHQLMINMLILKLVTLDLTFLLILEVQCTFTFCATHQFSLTLPGNQIESSATARIKKRYTHECIDVWMFCAQLHILLPVLVFTVSIAALEVHVAGEG